MSRDFTIIDCEQRTPAWFSARCGRVTGSKAKIVFMGDKTGGRDDYLLQLALERRTGVIEPEPYCSADMRRGIEMEPWVRLQTEIEYGVTIRQTGFVQHNSMMIGMSFDGDIDDFECFTEFKAPKSKTHIRYKIAKVLPSDYKPQVMHGHLVSGAKHSIFCSGDDRCGPGLNLFFYESNINDLPMDEYQKALTKFLDQVRDKETELSLLKMGKL